MKQYQAPKLLSTGFYPDNRLPVAVDMLYFRAAAVGEMRVGVESPADLVEAEAVAVGN